MAAPFAPTARLGRDPRVPHAAGLSVDAKHSGAVANVLEDVFRARRRVNLGGWNAWAKRHLFSRSFEEAWLREHSAWFEGRETFMKQFKPNVTASILLFSTADARTVFRFAAYTDALEAVIAPLLEAAGVNESRVTRLQIARMPPRSQIKPHVDSGWWAENQHRVHVPLAVPPATAFLSFVKGAFRRVPVETGLPFEINNKVPHAVYNAGNAPRYHLLIDERTADDRIQPVHVLPPGTVCNYYTADHDRDARSCVSLATSTYDPRDRAAANRRRAARRLRR